MESLEWGHTGSKKEARVEKTVSMPSATLGTHRRDDDDDNDEIFMRVDEGFCSHAVWFLSL